MESISCARPCQSASDKDLHRNAVSGARDQISGELGCVPALAHFKCQENSLHLKVPHCKRRWGRNSSLPFPKGAIKQYLAPSSYGIVGSTKWGGKSNLTALLNSVKVHPVSREYSLLRLKIPQCFG